ncbi:MAG: hypothetical protein AB7O80_26815, partial [Acetobacteraceae bacterium]
MRTSGWSARLHQRRGDTEVAGHWSWNRSAEATRRSWVISAAAATRAQRPTLVFDPRHPKSFRQHA